MREVLEVSPEKPAKKGKKGKASGKEEPPPPPPVAEAPSASSSPPSHPLLHFACGTVWEVVSAKPCQLRADFELTSDKAGEVAGGTIVYVLDQRPTPDGATRMSVCPEGQSASIGWLTGITKDGKKNLQQLGRPVCEVIAAKPLAARAAFELTSAKAGEVACKAMIHVLEAKETADGAHRVAYASAGSDSPKGWVTAITKDGTVNLSLVKDVKATLAASAVTSGGVDSPAPTGGAATASARRKGSGAKGSAGGGTCVRRCVLRWSGSSSSASPAATKLLLASRLQGSIVSAKAALVRAGVELNSDKVGELAPGSVVHIIEERENADGSKRVQFSLEGEVCVQHSSTGRQQQQHNSSQPSKQQHSSSQAKPSSSTAQASQAAQPKQASSTGTGTASRQQHSLTPSHPYPTPQQVAHTVGCLITSGVQNLKTLSRPLVEVSAVKALQARAEFELTSAKAGEIAPGASVYLLSVRQTADLAWRVGFASEGEEEGGIKAWVTAITKDGLENFKVSVPTATAQCLHGRQHSHTPSPHTLTHPHPLTQVPQMGGPPSGKGKATARGGGGTPRNSAATQRHGKGDSGGGGATAEEKKAAATALAEKRAKEAQEEAKREAEERKIFEEKKKKDAEEKAKKEQDAKKALEEKQKKVRECQPRGAALTHKAAAALTQGRSSHSHKAAHRPPLTPPFHCPVYTAAALPGKEGGRGERIEMERAGRARRRRRSMRRRRRREGGGGEERAREGA